MIIEMILERRLHSAQPRGIRPTLPLYNLPSFGF
jgi:hypothetical protein